MLHGTDHVEVRRLSLDAASKRARHDKNPSKPLHSSSFSLSLLSKIRERDLQATTIARVWNFEMLGFTVRIFLI